MRAQFGEAIGTFVLVFAGTGAIVVNSVSGGAVTHVGVSLVFGLTVMALVHALGDVSGAHLNPAVTIAFAVAGRSPWRGVPGFVIAQLCGAFAASAVLSWLFPASATLGATLPSGSTSQSFLLEVLLSWILMLVILSVSDGARERGSSAAFAIGAVVALEALFAGPITGASMNPARSLAPGVMSGATRDLWVYMSAPVVGMSIAVPFCSWLRLPGCCPTRGACS